MDIYLGSGIEHASERIVLQELARLLVGTLEALVLVNLNLSGRQIDLVLCLEGKAILLEAKGYTRPVRGRQNGPWEVHLATGAWKQSENAYVQALQAKNALRDAMSIFASSEPPYPAAAVVFVPAIPAGAELEPGDFKVSIIGLERLEALIHSAPANSWCLDEWRAFAGHHRLSRVATVEAACDERLRAEERLLASYSAEFFRTYGLDAERLVNLACKSENEFLSSDDIVREIGSGRAELLVRGPSGCGKSLLALRGGIAALGNGVAPVFIAAKYFEGNVKSMLDREVGLLAPCSAIQLFTVALRQGRKILLIVDGYNECREDRRGALTRCVAALGRRFECAILVTSQIAPVRAELLRLRQIEVPPPTSDVKRAVALQARSGNALSPHLEVLIDAVTSGLEARLVGEVGQELGLNTSRHQLFDAFARSRLGRRASEGIRALTQIAEWLNEHVTFSVSVRDLDRLSLSEEISSATLETLTENGLLISRARRISFAHEMFFSAFAAESVVRRSQRTVDSIVKALRDPRHSDRKDLIVGAIEDPGMLTAVLEQMPDTSLLASCLSGACGRFPREWAERRYPQVLSCMRAEVNGVLCAFSTESMWGVTVHTERLIPQESPDWAFVQHLPNLLSQGVHLNEVLQMCEVLDQRLANERTRLREEATQRRVGLKSSMFAEAYAVPTSRGLALSHVCSRLHGELFRVSRSLIPEIARQITDNPTPGRLYVLMSLCRHVEDDSDSPDASLLVHVITESIEQHGRRAPYHLQMALVDAARHCNLITNGPGRERLIEALKSMLDDRNIAINSMIFDVLQQLNAFASEELDLEPRVSQEIDDLLAEADDPERWVKADRLYTAQFDGPYSNAYWEVVNGLSDVKRKSLLAMAAKGAENPDHFLPLLIIDLAAFDDPNTGAAIARWTKAPPGNSFMPQVAIEVFVLAHVALARLRIDLPAHDGAEDAAQALHACGQLLYWANRLDVHREARDGATRKAWAVLSADAAGNALNALSSCADTMIRTTDKLPGHPSATTSLPKRQRSAEMRWSIQRGS